MSAGPPPPVGRTRSGSVVGAFTAARSQVAASMPDVDEHGPDELDCIEERLPKTEPGIREVHIVQKPPSMLKELEKAKNKALKRCRASAGSMDIDDIDDDELLLRPPWLG